MTERVSATVTTPVKKWLAVKGRELDMSESATVNEVLKDAMKREKPKPSK